MITEKRGKVVKGLGGLYITRAVKDGKVTYVESRAKGTLKRDDEKVLIGDNVVLTEDSSTPDGIVISEVLPRKNSLIRPPLSNLDYLFIVFAAKRPAPVLETVDKLVSIAEHNGITPVIIVTKADMDAEAAAKYADIYNRIGISSFVTSSHTGSGVEALSSFVKQNVNFGKVSAFAGASGVGKSTLMNALFPNLSLATQDLSHKIERGKHTTRHVEIFAIEDSFDTGFIADTPGFSLIDFDRFDFFELSDLEATFRDIIKYKGQCRYQDCAHVGEGKDECAVMQALIKGELSQTRLDSYRSIYKSLKAKEKDYNKK